ncbi:MAG TPA: orotate phosphoribosyltransferase [Anaerolineae bacterium]|nr:orotate phosphoribosyltransferase [Anaerolineae bacterium]
MVEENVERLILDLYDIGAVQLGKFRLHSGATARIYIDLRILVSFPAVLRRAVAILQVALEDIEFDLLAATPYAGLPIGTALCLALDKPLVYPRKAPKQYGMGKNVEGVWQVGQTAVIVDDQITSGDSLVQAAAALKASGLQVKQAVVLIDRQQGGAGVLEAQGSQLKAVMNVTQMLAILERHEKISAKQRAKVLKSLKR